MDGTSMSDSSSSESTGSSPEPDLAGWPANSGMGSREFNDMSSVLEMDGAAAAPKSELKEGAGWLGVRPAGEAEYDFGDEEGTSPPAQPPSPAPPGC